MLSKAETSREEAPLSQHCPLRRPRRAANFGQPGSTSRSAVNVTNRSALTDTGGLRTRPCGN